MFRFGIMDKTGKPAIILTKGKKDEKAYIYYSQLVGRVTTCASVVAAAGTV